MLENLKASVKLEEGGLKFEGTSGDNYKVKIDYSKPHGEGDGTTSLELFLTSLCACLSATLTAMLQHYGHQIDELSISADGTRRQRHPRSFEVIDMLVKVKTSASEKEVQDALSAAHSKICPVSALVKGNVEINYTLELS